MSLSDQLTRLINKAAADLPSLLVSAGVQDFAVYSIYKPAGEGERYFSVWPHSGEESPENTEINFIFRVSLAGEGDANLTVYHDVTAAWLRGLDPGDYGVVTFDQLRYFFWPAEMQTAPTIEYLLTGRSPQDSCD